MQLSDLQILAGHREEGEGRGQWVAVGEVHFVKIQRYTCITMCTILKCVLYVCMYSGTPLFYRGVALSQGCIFVLYLGLSKVAFTEGVSSRQGWPLRGAPLYSVVRTFTEGGGVSSHQGWPLRGAPLYSVVRTFTEGGGVSSRQGWPLRGAPLYSVARTLEGGCPHIKRTFTQRGVGCPHVKGGL